MTTIETTNKDITVKALRAYISWFSGFAKVAITQGNAQSAQDYLLDVAQAEIALTELENQQ